MRRVLHEGGRAALSVYNPIERTPGANALVRTAHSLRAAEVPSEDARTPAKAGIVTINRAAKLARNAAI